MPSIVIHFIHIYVGFLFVFKLSLVFSLPSEIIYLHMKEIQQDFFIVGLFMINFYFYLNGHYLAFIPEIIFILHK